MRSVVDKQFESTWSAASNSADLIRLKTAVYMLYVAVVCFTGMASHFCMIFNTNPLSVNSLYTEMCL